MKGGALAQIVHTNTDGLYKDYSDLINKYQNLLTEFDQIKTENEILRVIIGE